MHCCLCSLFVVYRRNLQVLIMTQLWHSHRISVNSSFIEIGFLFHYEMQLRVSQLRWIVRGNLFIIHLWHSAACHRISIEDRVLSCFDSLLCWLDVVVCIMLKRQFVVSFLFAVVVVGCCLWIVLKMQFVVWSVCHRAIQMRKYSEVIDPEAF